MTPRVGVLALQGDVREHCAALAAVGAEPVPVRRPGELPGVDGMILPGGESTTIGLLLDRAGLLEPLRAAVAGGLPTYGSCAGMILLANELVDGRPGQPLIGGLDAVVRRNAFGRQVDSFEGEVEVAGLPAPEQPGQAPDRLHAVFIRAPWVESAGPGVTVLGRVPAAALRTHGQGGPPPSTDRIVAVRQGRLLATAFHPELTGDLRVHRMFVDLVRAADGEDGGRAT